MSGVVQAPLTERAPRIEITLLVSRNPAKASKRRFIGSHGCRNDTCGSAHMGRDFLDWEWGLHFVCVKQTSWGVMTNMVMRR
jgi:hypothetical protein